MQRWFAPALLLLMAGLVSPASGAAPTQENPEPKTVRLKFRPVPVKPLRKAQPKPSWQRVKTVKLDAFPSLSVPLRDWADWHRAETVKLGAFPGKAEAAIHLYLDPDSAVGGATGDIYGFLEDNQVMYGLGVVHVFGVEGVDFRKTDRQHNGNFQWEISGALGGAGGRLVIVSFDRKQNRWVYLLSAEFNGIDQLDLAGDGEEEIVTRFGVDVDYTIYRWSLDHFESVDLDRALGSDYVKMAQRDGRWVFQPYKVINAHTGEHRDGPCFRYAKGKLFELGVH